MQKVVVIDDEELFCRSLQRILSDVCDVDCCITPKQAHDYFATHADPELILIDYQIQGDDGVQLFKDEVVDKGKHIPAILISAYVGGNKDTPLQKNAEKYFSNVIGKPFDAFVLRSMVKELLNKPVSA